MNSWGGIHRFGPWRAESNTLRLYVLVTILGYLKHGYQKQNESSFSPRDLIHAIPLKNMISTVLRLKTNGDALKHTNASIGRVKNAVVSCGPQFLDTRG